MKRPRALVLFSGAGGVCVGLDRAGFDVTSVDILPMPRHRGGQFVQADALTFDLSGFDVIHASPPCQAYLSGALNQAGRYPRLIATVRAKIESEAPGVPYVIENVPAARAEMRAPLLLCGTMFPALKVYRHRLFESNVLLMAPPHGPHRETFPRAGRGANANGWICVCGNMKDPAAGRAAMGIDWMNRRELAETIPPIYAEHIGRQILQAL